MSFSRKKGTFETKRAPGFSFGIESAQAISEEGGTARTKVKTGPMGPVGVVVNSPES
jgi:hypothetical protein